MPGFIRTWGVALVVAGIGLAALWAGCNITIQLPDDGTDGTQVNGSTPQNPGSTTAPADDPSTPSSGGDDSNSPCSDSTNIYVTYKNEASGRVGFVENFRDGSNTVLAGAMFVLEPAGQAGDTQSKCITCPNQAGIRNLQYVINGSWTWVQYPPDLSRGTFSCGDHITFVFKNNGSVTTDVARP